MPPLRLEYRDPATLAANPANWRRHPPAQAAALKAALGEVGWAGALLYNETTGRLIDGHLRQTVASGEQVPVLVGSWTEEQERLILATLDPLAAMAQADGDALIALLGSLDVQDRALADMLEALANGERQPIPEPEVGFQSRFELVIECASEQELRELFDTMSNQGKKCRPLIL